MKILSKLDFFSLIFFNLKIKRLLYLSWLIPQFAYTNQYQNLNESSNFTVEGLYITDFSVIETEIKICQCLNDYEKLKQTLLATGLFYDVQILFSIKKYIFALKKNGRLSLFLN